MRTRTLALGTVVALAAAALTGCVPLGPMTSTSPEIGDVSAVVLDAAGDLEIREGEPALTIHAPANILGSLTAEERDGALVLGRRPGASAGGFGRVRYELTVRDLTSIEVNGAGDVDADVSGDDLTLVIDGAGDVTVSGISAESVDVRIDGTGDVELDGTATSLAVAINGAGSVDSDDLEVQDAVAEIHGAGDLRTHVTGTLRVEIGGVGSVHHRGGADVESDIEGLGDVVADD